MNKGDIVEITIEDISNDGQGIGKACGLAVFVSDTVVGDRIAAELIKLKKNYAIGRMTEMLAPSPRQDRSCLPIRRPVRRMYIPENEVPGPARIEEETGIR